MKWFCSLEPLAFRDVYSGSSFFPFAKAQVNSWVIWVRLSCVRCLCVTLSWVSISPSACDVDALVFFGFVSRVIDFSLTLVQSPIMLKCFNVSSYRVTRNLCGNPAKSRKSFLYRSLDLFCLIKLRFEAFFRIFIVHAEWETNKRNFPGIIYPVLFRLRRNICLFFHVCFLSS